MEAVDRVFPALNQVEMQLACKHVLNALFTSSNGSGGSTVPALTIPASQSATANASADPSFTGRESSHNGGHVQQHQPDWLQQTDDLDTWILQNIADRARRVKMVQALKDMAAPFKYGASKVIKALGNLNSENVS